MTPRDDLSQIAHRLIVHAADRAPSLLCERLREEWLADFQQRRGSLARLRLAIGCCWAATIISRDFAGSQLAESGAAGAHKTLFTGLASALLPQFSHRTIIFGMLAGCAVLMFSSLYVCQLHRADWSRVETSIPIQVSLRFPVESPVPELKQTALPQSPAGHP